MQSALIHPYILSSSSVFHVFRSFWCQFWVFSVINSTMMFWRIISGGSLSTFRRMCFTDTVMMLRYSFGIKFIVTYWSIRISVFIKMTSRRACSNCVIIVKLVDKRSAFYNVTSLHWSNPLLPTWTMYCLQICAACNRLRCKQAHITFSLSCDELCPIFLLKSIIY